MRRAEVYRNNQLAGYLIEESLNDYLFIYEDKYFADGSQPAISLTMPKSQKEYRSEFLFPFFFNMLSEGVNKKLQNRQLKIDESDYFGLLLETAMYDTIGAISVKRVE